MIEWVVFVLASIPLAMPIETGELVFVQALWRHGDRAPIKHPYPKDKYAESCWIYGWKELTNIGMKQMYDVGRFFKRKYGDFVGEFRNDKVRVVSTTSRRAITSAQSMLYGFFPAEGKTVWMEGATWRPIPFEIDNNDQLRDSKFHCPSYKTIFEVDVNNLSDQIYEKYGDVFKFLEEKSGIPNLELVKAKSLVGIQNEIDNGLPQDEWVYKLWPNHRNLSTLQLIDEFANKLRQCQTDSIVKAKLRAGLVLNEWLKMAKNISINLKTKPERMLLYSAHQPIFRALLSTLEVHRNLTVPYASSLIMEVYKAPDGTKVKWLIRNNTESDHTYTLVVPGCEEMCPIEKLIELKKPYVVESFIRQKELCAMDPDELMKTVGKTIASAVR